MRVLTLALVAAGLAGLSSAAAAQPAQGRFVHPADADRDQRLSPAEWRASSQAEFSKADANGDGYVDGPEFVRSRYGSAASAGQVGSAAERPSAQIALPGPAPAIEVAGRTPLEEARERMIALRATLKPGSEEYRDLESSIRDLDEAITSLKARYSGG